MSSRDTYAALSCKHPSAVGSMLALRVPQQLAEAQLNEVWGTGRCDKDGALPSCRLPCGLDPLGQSGSL